MKRYDWEDALVDAQTTGLIPNGALLVALKLARAINWKPKDGRPAGLYWKNEDALEFVGASRATYFRYRKSLLETGFFAQENGNLLPTIPAESQIETEKSHIETKESQVETEKSLGDNPLSVDILSDDVWSEDKLSEEQATVSDEPVGPIREEVSTLDTSLITLEPAPFLTPKEKADAAVRRLRAEHARQQKLTVPVREPIEEEW